MKIVSYAGQQLVTSDDVAETLVELAASIAREGGSEALQIPILVDGEKDCADLIVGVGNDLLVGPHVSEDPEPDFSDDVAALKRHRSYPEHTSVARTDDDDEGDWADDIDYEIETGLRNAG